MDFFTFFKPLLYCLSPEAAHDLAISSLKYGVVPNLRTSHSDALRVALWGLQFNNPVGLAAGFDKNGAAIDALLQQGFGFIEVGTVTPKPQAGNPKPRLFRLTEDQAVINRFGFNNLGAEYFVKNLKSRTQAGIVGANIGKNKESTDALEDYITLLRRVYGLSDYITINISSPNTPGLRDLQSKGELDGFLAAIMQEKAVLQQGCGKNIPILLKLAPDTDIRQREDMAEAVLARGVDGLIISNTTTSREGLTSPQARENGGMSGKPLLAASTQMVRDMYRLTGGKVPIIGVGGISSGEDAYAKIRAGASLVQVYSALVFQGFGLVRRINEELAELLRHDGFANVAEAVGVGIK